jgi:hypothetical protein
LCGREGELTVGEVAAQFVDGGEGCLSVFLCRRQLPSKVGNLYAAPTRHRMVVNAVASEKDGKL